MPYQTLQCPISFHHLVSNPSLNPTISALTEPWPWEAWHCLHPTTPGHSLTGAISVCFNEQFLIFCLVGNNESWHYAWLPVDGVLQHCIKSDKALICHSAAARPVICISNTNVYIAYCGPMYISSLWCKFKNLSLKSNTVAYNNSLRILLY